MMSGLDLLRLVKKLIVGYTHVETEKMKLTEPTIVIDPTAWRFFARDSFDSDAHIVYCDLDSISKEDYQHIVSYIGAPDKSRLKELTNLRWLQISSHGTNGYEKADLYPSNNVLVSNVKDVFAEPIAQYCIAAYYMFKTFSWRRMIEKKTCVVDTCTSTNDTTVLIMGMGNIGSKLAQKCKQQGWRVYGVKQHIPEKKPEYVDRLVTMQEVFTVIDQVDYVVNLLPENKSTIGVYGYSFFKKLKRSAVFCNVGRGSAVNDEELERAVEEGFCGGGVILDAASKRKYRSPRIILTHHSSYRSIDNDSAFDRYYSSQLQRFIAGELVNNVIPLE